ncbi:MAG: HNH endonuclease [Bacteroidales bacterium]|jgi:predicted HNH restriction endonuclease|nr:HNH endonuclease [Bacteroidales bacterium]MDD4673063.1 HNH endonuclease [Bacteroidales bacterium]
MAKRITETELILPSLYLMKLNGGRITSSKLIEKLRLIMKPSGEDLDILSGRSDDKFSQKVRNLKAHETFERFGYAQYKGDARKGFVEITSDGKKHLKRNQEILKYLLVNDFEYVDIKKNLKELESEKGKKKRLVFDENIIIQEGIKKIAQVKVYERSTKLRNYAIEHFTKDGHIACKCCSFDFENFYGAEIGKGFIEIHHTKPIFQYKDSEIENTLENALKNLVPVCSNCHRMIHRNWSKPLEIQYLIGQIERNGIL